MVPRRFLHQTPEGWEKNLFLCVDLAERDRILILPALLHLIHLDTDHQSLRVHAEPQFSISRIRPMNDILNQVQDDTFSKSQIYLLRFS
jgi:hypothetical protein